MQDKVFKIRTYGFSELASAYKPNLTKKSASSYFNRLIKNNPELNENLKQVNYKPRMQTLSPLMVAAFVEFLGEPY